MRPSPTLLLATLMLGCSQTGDGTDPATTADTSLVDPADDPDLTDLLPPECTEDYVNDVFDRYIEPLVSGGQPTSCNQCHLSGLDLSVYVQDTPCQSMACMVEAGVVDLDVPQDSEVLAWIMRAEPTSGLITEDVIQREYDAFLQWIEWSAECQSGVCGEIADPCNSGTGTTPEDVETPLGNCTEADLGAQFEAEVYVWRDRCAGCHEYNALYNEDGLAPEWIDPANTWDAVLASMYNAIGLGMFDVDDPAASTIILKPLDEAVGGIPHGGGIKIETWDSPTAAGFLSFAEYWASCQ